MPITTDIVALHSTQTLLHCIQLMALVHNYAIHGTLLYGNGTWVLMTMHVLGLRVMQIVSPGIPMMHEATFRQEISVLSKY